MRSRLVATIAFAALAIAAPAAAAARQTLSVKQPNVRIQAVCPDAPCTITAVGVAKFTLVVKKEERTASVRLTSAAPKTARAPISSDIILSINTQQIRAAQRKLYGEDPTTTKSAKGTLRVKTTATDSGGNATKASQGIAIALAAPPKRKNP